MKTISVPANRKEKKYVQWQESERKAIERGFGVVQSKNRALVRPVELHNPAEIHDMVIGCLMLHNMMVDYRLSLGQTESAEHYVVGEGSTSEELLDRVSDFIMANDVDDYWQSVQVRNRLGGVEEDMGGTPAGEVPPHHRCLSHSYKEAQKRRLAVVQATYDDLATDDGEHIRLRNAIVRHLDSLCRRTRDNNSST